MTALRRLVPTLGLVLGLVPASCLAACTGGEASDDGTALLRNETDRDGLRVYVLARDGRTRIDRALDPFFRFDTQDPDRTRQCLVARDGSFEVRDPDGTVLVQHDFADRPVCEHDELEVNDHLTLVWLK